jgi:hypothetical protein
MGDLDVYILQFFNQKNIVEVQNTFRQNCVFIVKILERKTIGVKRFYRIFLE